MDYSKKISVIANGALVVCALLVTASVVRSQFITPTPPIIRSSAMFEDQPDWREYAVAGQRIGRADAKVTLVEFSDFECPACRALATQLHEIMAESPERLAVIYRHMPLASHRFAEQAAIASECSAKFTKFAAMHDTLFAAQRSIGVTPWSELAASIGIADTVAFKHCMKDPASLARVNEDKAAAEKLGVKGTPTVLINGVRFAGVPHRKVLDSLIDLAVSQPRK